MIVFIIYLLIFALLIYKNGFFKLFNDEQVTKKTFSFIFIIKALAVPAFYFLFVKLYGGIEKFDAGKFYADAKVMNHLAFVNFPEYLKMLFGLQDDSEGSYFYKTCIETTFNWDNGASKNYMYNDNRIVIRIHSLLHFIAFNSYFVHGLFSCFFSLIGLTYLYKSFKEFFSGKEIWLLLTICFFPTLWLYTGAVLKEGLTIFLLGCSIYNIKKIIGLRINIFNILWMIILIFMSLLLKPYILFYALVYFSLFFGIHTFYKGKNKTLLFLSSLIIIVLIANFASILIKHSSFKKAAFEREKEFADLAKGGIFLLDSVKFVRLEYNYNLVKKVPGKKNYQTIKKNVPYTYWENSHQQDTLYCIANMDTLTQYALIYDLPAAGSNFDIGINQHHLFVSICKSLYYTLANPFFYNAKKLMQLFASVENLILIVSIFIVLIGIVRNKKDGFIPLAFIFFGLSLFIVIGITTPNSGALLRYRAPAAIFIIVASLYYVQGFKRINPAKNSV